MQEITNHSQRWYMANSEHPSSTIRLVESIKEQLELNWPLEEKTTSSCDQNCLILLKTIMQTPFLELYLL